MNIALLSQFLLVSFTLNLDPDETKLLYFVPDNAFAESEFRQVTAYYRVPPTPLNLLRRLSPDHDYVDLQRVRLR